MAGDRNQTVIHTCDNITQWGIIALAFLVPLVINPFGYDMYGLPKIVLTCLLVMVILAAWLINNLQNDQPQLARTSLFLPITLFLLLAFVSTLKSVNIANSLYGSFERYEGLLSLLIYVFIYFIAASTFRTYEKIQKLQLALVVSGAIIAIYGVLQHFGLDFINWSSAKVDFTRIVSTLGNSNFLADFLVIALVLAIAFYLASSSWATRGPLFICTGLLFIALLFTYSRAGWLGFAVSLLVLLTLLPKQLLAKRKIQLGLLCAFLVLCLIIVNYVPKLHLGYQGAPSITKQAASSIQTGEGTAAARLYIWETAINMTKDRPLLGWGIENFGTIYPKYRSLNLAHLEGGDYIPDKPHNELLQISTGMGLLGLLAFLWLVFTFVATAWRKVATEPLEKRLLLSGMLAGWIGYFVAIQFNFSIAGPALVSWLLMGTLLANEKKGVQAPWSLRKSVQAVLLALALCIVLFLGIVSLKWLAADTYFVKGVEAMEATDNSAALTSLEQAVKLNPTSPTFSITLTQVYLASSRSTGNPVWAEEAFKLAQSLVNQDPLNPYHRMLLSQTFIEQYNVTGNQTWLRQSETQAKKAIELDPKSATAHYNLGQLYEGEKQYQKARYYYQQALRLDRKNKQAKKALGRLRGKNK